MCFLYTPTTNQNEIHFLFALSHPPPPLAPRYQLFSCLSFLLSVALVLSELSFYSLFVVLCCVVLLFTSRSRGRLLSLFFSLNIAYSLWVTDSLTHTSLSVCSDRRKRSVEPAWGEAGCHPLSSISCGSVLQAKLHPCPYRQTQRNESTKLNRLRPLQRQHPLEARPALPLRSTQPI